MAKVAFMVMPFNDEVALQAYNHCIKGVCERHDLTIRRADEIFTTNPIWDDIVQEIQNASVVIVDVSGRNPNVFYELGVAHTLKRTQTIMVTHDAFEETPFDIAHFRMLRYENSIEGSKRFEKELDSVLNTILQDYLTIYRDEFVLIEQIMGANALSTSVLAALVGVNKIGRPAGRDERFAMEYDRPGRGSDRRSGADASLGGTIEQHMEPLDRLGFVEMKGDLISLTPKGHALAEFAERQGWVCHYLNGTVLSSGYTPQFPLKDESWPTGNSQPARPGP